MTGRCRRVTLPVAALLLAACGSGGETGSASQDDELTVLAASSLTGVFETLKTDFEDQHPGVDVTLAFDSSTTLATQVVDGAPGDVLATADETSMQIVTDADAATGDPVRFATNTIVLVVPAANPASVRTVADLERNDVDWLMCDPSAPCGRLAQADLDGAGVSGEPASLEVDVKSVLAKVVAGEADAGLVYATDSVAAGDDVRSIPIPGAEARANRYLIAPVSDSSLAQEWVDLVTGDAGRSVLRAAGFGSP